jgi:hypothetical protein
MHFYRGLEQEKPSSSNEACISAVRVRVIIMCTSALQDSDSLVGCEVSILEQEKPSSSNEACISAERVRVIIICTGALQDSGSLVGGEVSIRRFCCMRSFCMRLITSA